MTDANDAVKNESQVLEMLQTGRRITHMQVYDRCGTYRLAEYILRLRKRGLTIESQWETNGRKRYKSYWLAK